MTGHCRIGQYLKWTTNAKSGGVNANTDERTPVEESQEMETAAEDPAGGVRSSSDRPPVPTVELVRTPRVSLAAARRYRGWIVASRWRRVSVE